MRYLVLFILMTVMLGACKDDTGTLQIKFIGTYDGEPLVFGENVDYDGYQLYYLESDFFVSELAVLNEGEVTEVKDFEYVNFGTSNNSLEDAENGVVLSYSDVPVGTYDGLRFGIGVPPVENKTRPSDYSSEHALSTGGHYWEAWDSFIFAKVAGRYEDTEGTFDNGFFFHTGTDEMFRTSTGTLNFTISEDNTSVIEVIIDHKKLLEEQNGGYYDIQSNAENHDLTNPAPLLMLVNNYGKAISYKN